MSPIAPPPAQPPRYELPPSQEPAGWRWYRVLLVVMVLMQGLIAWGGLSLRNNAEWFHQQNPDTNLAFITSSGNTLIVMGAIFTLLNIGLFFLPRKPWAYGLHLTNAVAGIALCCPAPLAIWVVIMLLKPDCKDWYGA